MIWGHTGTGKDSKLNTMTVAIFAPHAPSIVHQSVLLVAHHQYSDRELDCDGMQFCESFQCPVVGLRYTDTGCSDNQSLSCEYIVVIIIIILDIASMGIAFLVC